ncbi:MAG TPA: alpha/beta hydrolase [Allosphingosinicella sp.]|nr:alpha/beta hydrolase [Allosphingosinicella sp.]
MTYTAALAVLAAGAASLAPAQPGQVAPSAAPAATAPAEFAPTRFSVEVVGSGPDVILIPGLTASREVWRGTVNAVPGYRYHLLQVAGFAGAPARGNATGEVVAPLAAEIARYIDANRLRGASVVGHSMGGTVAMMVAARHPGRAGKVMVVDMLPQPAGLVGSSPERARALAEALRGLSGSEEGRRLIGSAIRMFGNPESAENGSDPDVVARATHELALTDLTPELPRIAAPLTVVYAGMDASRSAQIARNYTAAYASAKGARLVRIDNSGHMIMYEQPTAFRTALKSFLAN